VYVTIKDREMLPSRKLTSASETCGGLELFASGPWVFFGLEVGGGIEVLTSVVGLCSGGVADGLIELVASGLNVGSALEFGGGLEVLASVVGLRSGF
jgi:hypothetical protein